MLERFTQCLFSPIILFLTLICSLQSVNKAQDQTSNEKILRTIANAIIEDATFEFADTHTGKHFKSTKVVPDSCKLKLASRYNDWRYWNGIINIALLKLANELNEPLYKEYSLENIAFTFDNYKYFEKNYNDEGKWNYPFGEFFIMEELDDCGAMGANVIEVYKLDPQERYKEYIDKAANHILNKQSQLEDRTLVRSFPHMWTLWADDLYMGISFLSRMGELTGDQQYFDFATKQVINFNNYLFNDGKELMYHNWYSDINHTGVAFWGRANGWALLAQVDLLDHLPENYSQRDTLISLLKRHILGIAKYQSSSGLWHQLLDKEDSYLETSCSAMFTYAIARAVNKGYIDKRYSSIAEKGWEGIITKIHPEGQIEGVCTGTVVSDNLVDYYNRPTPINDIHGIGTVLLAGSEVIHLE
ncbi:glycoside hydrolase family 88 protein [bacterium BMS3Abin03]|jgi:rhamnogalacturonyl hydrolase YesR|nr:glycoside hydrolase family 88 protein [bacterium BMS3Abin03]MCG6958912.1 glycoside hydrolase family 88 protein [bacterium BMS3Abin03]